MTKREMVRKMEIRKIRCLKNMVLRFEKTALRTKSLLAACSLSGFVFEGGFFAGHYTVCVLGEGAHLVFAGIGETWPEEGYLPDNEVAPGYRCASNAPNGFARLPRSRIAPRPGILDAAWRQGFRRHRSAKDGRVQ